MCCDDGPRVSQTSALRLLRDPPVAISPGVNVAVAVPGGVLPVVPGAVVAVAGVVVGTEGSATGALSVVVAVGVIGSMADDGPAPPPATRNPWHAAST